MKDLSRLLLVFLLAFCSLAARAGDADFTLVNKTGYEIESVYVAPSKQRSWGSDFLKGRTLRNGQKLDIAFNKNKGVCVYDMRVHWVGYGEEEDAVWERLDLCAVHTITLRYNRNTNETSAEFD